MSKTQKSELFQQILLTIGIGAKTNVGYGQFSEMPRVVSSNLHKNTTEEEKKTETPKPEKKHKITKYDLYKKGAEIVVQVLTIEEKWVSFKVNNDILFKSKDAIVNKWEEDGKKRISKGKSDTYKELSVGSTVTIRINQDFNITDQNFTILPQWT